MASSVCRSYLKYSISAAIHRKMNTLRSTERSLTLLTLKNAQTIFKPKRAFQSGTFKPFGADSKKSYVRTGSKFLNSNHSFRTPKIKVIEAISSRSLSSSNPPPNEKTFLNPTKPDADEAKTLTIQPIIPMTFPRFPKNLSETTPSVTRVLQDTMPAASRFFLEKWKESMIKKLGFDGFIQYQKDTFERGHALHALLANYLLGRGEPSEGQGQLSREIITNLWNSIQGVVKEKISNVRLVEHIVTHPSMNYRGIVDCVAFYEDELVVIDFKTAEKPKKNIESLYDNPLQVTAYCGAINNDTNLPKHVIDRNICSGLVIIAYTDGSKASTYYLSSEQVKNDYWKQWTTRLDQYVRLEEIKQRENKKSAIGKKKI